MAKEIIGVPVQGECVDSRQANFYQPELLSESGFRYTRMNKQKDRLQRITVDCQVRH